MKPEEPKKPEPRPVVRPIEAESFGQIARRILKRLEPK